MKNLLLFLYIFNFVINISKASHNGPFLIWGHSDLKSYSDRPLLEKLPENELESIFSTVSEILIFVQNNENNLLRNGEMSTIKENFMRKDWLYSPQQKLSPDPYSYNANIKEIQLEGSHYEQIKEINEKFDNAVEINGEGKVLGILAMNGKLRQKRKTKTEPKENHYIFIAKNKCLIHTTHPMQLQLLTKRGEQLDLNLAHAIWTSFEKSANYSRFYTSFLTPDNSTLKLGFNFKLSVDDYWSLSECYVGFKNTWLTLIAHNGPIPEAPIGFSYKCSAHNLVFRDLDSELRIKNYQIQPFLNDANKFSDAYDCIDFVSVPILSGLLVSFLLILALLLGVVAIMDIKTPTKFEIATAQHIKQVNMLFATQDDK